jgi:tripartite-type tricarboxylate transporter receptor subunit TctC
LFPEIPSSVESGVANYDFRFWYGLYAPANLPLAISNKLFSASIEALKDIEVQKKLAIAGMETAPSLSQADFKSLTMIDGQKTEAMGKIIGKAD